ncbi:MAG: bifunctional precorrin-2 dehydrogenase/sirohydrochlorin ferrochelatase [Nitrosarchaeum sp.]|nr:bifunctional precorrin-2 dehydrogenase/sirohydrochlorin ferrochelatase [Nitrosarchaeum sp.]MCV0399280.1 bifunctional precorrin-2 dehydrogenase/sirohydrochlorin ferrochelatase [Nitrosarchaeum sp.]
MIVDLNLQGKKVVVIGGGNESLKRITPLLKQNCEILVISGNISSQINRLAKSKKIKLINQNIQDISFISKYKPSLIITTTNDKKLNQRIIRGAKKRRIIAYSSDNPEESDFSNPAIIDFENTIQIAIFTGGKSPAMSKRLKEEAEKIFKKIITKKDISQIKLQKIAREKAKKKIPTQIERKEYIRRIMADKEIDQLIKDGQMKKAEKRADTILGDWK